MAKVSKESDVQIKEKEATFSREQVLQSIKYRPYYDILGITLKDGVQYTENEIYKFVNEFLSNPVVEERN